MPNAFVPKKHDPKLNTYYDEFYISRKLVDSVVKTGDGDEDFSIVKKVVETKQNIQEIIDSQADEVGLDNILKRYAATGDPSILPETANVNNSEVVDYSAMPQDLIEAGQTFARMQAEFDSLPEALKKGRNFTEFMSTINQNEFDTYINSLKPVDDKKEGDK